MDSFKSRLLFYMIKAGFNPTSLAKRAGLNTTAIRDILKHPGTPNPRIDTFIKLCTALDLEPHQLSLDFANLYSARHLELLESIEKTTEMTAKIENSGLELIDYNVRYGTYRTHSLQTPVNSPLRRINSLHDLKKFPGRIQLASAPPGAGQDAARNT